MDDDRVAKIIDMAERRSVDQAAWFNVLAQNASGTYLPTVSNAMLILANDPDLAGMLAYDAFRSEHLLMHSPPQTQKAAPPMAGPYPRAWGAEDVALVQGYFQRVWSPKFARDTVEHAMLTEAACKRFHPVLDWLDGLAWDRKPRIDTWLSAAFDAENNPYHRAVGAKLLIAAVRRLRSPGCKFDHMLVLEGAQGIGKSRTLRALFREEYFSDAIPPDLTSKDAAMALLGVWCLEFAEIEHLIRTEVETIKAFLSRAVDRYRPPYGRAYVYRPRQGVLVGTTNSDEYLRDVTGNRRIWPVRCKTADPAWAEGNRDQLWAEAAAREARGETIWLDDSDVIQDATKAQGARMSEDVWTGAIAQWLLGRTEVRIADVLADAIQMPKDRQAMKDLRRVGDVLRSLGWTKAQARRAGGFNGKVWIPPTERPPDDPETTGQGSLM